VALRALQPNRYKATRIIAEVVIESLPQCLLQAYILVMVMSHKQQGTLDVSEHYLLEQTDFVTLLPKSITIATITMLKTWIELVQVRTRLVSQPSPTFSTPPFVPSHPSPRTPSHPSPLIPQAPPIPYLVQAAREAGTTVATKMSQLWNVGHGLPLDAIKKGSITEWSCTC
jgi:hypothetical protein